MALKEKMSSQLTEDELAIYDAHVSIVEDPALIENTIQLITSKNVSAEYALQSAAKEFMKILASIDDDYIKSRVKDIDEVTTDIINILQGQTSIQLVFEKPIILVAENITTNQLATIDKKMLLGIITAGGGATDHTSIISKAIGIPLITGIKEQLMHILNTSTIVMDAENGSILLEPDESNIASFKEKIQNLNKYKNAHIVNAKNPATTKSGINIKIYANIGNLEEAELADLNGADGIGLLRSELCFLDRKEVPTEEDHHTLYKEMLDKLPGKVVVIRLLDIGSDKKVSYLEMPKEENPALGLRALRLGFNQYEKLLKPQLRAILKLSANYNIKLLCPMIATPEDLTQIREAISKEIKILISEGVKLNEKMQVGIMVEIPNVAIMPELFIDNIDFFSFGTNDLAQYLMAADRTNSSVSNYLSKANPAILKMIEHVTSIAHLHGKWIGICGELSSQKELIEKFISIGIDELSMPPLLIPEIKSYIRSLN